MRERRSKPYMVAVTFCRKTLQMVIDTGASCSLFNRKTDVQTAVCTSQVGATFSKTNVMYRRCDPTSRRNKRTLGYEGQTKVVKLVVMKKEGLSLMGRDWIELVKLN